MKFNIDLTMKDLWDKKEKKIIKKMTNICLNEVFKGNKVSFLYENIKTKEVVSFNPDIKFYAASTIKILVCLMILRKVLNNELSIDEKILITMADLKQDTGVIKYQKHDTYYSIKKLLELTIVESDNTSYLKFVDMLGKKNIANYGKKLGAKNTMEGKETDSFGLISANDMLVYLKEVKKFIDENNKYSKLFKDYLCNPKVKFINDKSIENKTFVRKYGSYDIAYHEGGYVEDESSYYLIVMTQLNQKKYKEKFINDIAYNINKLHSVIKK